MAASERRSSSETGSGSGGISSAGSEQAQAEAIVTNQPFEPPK